MIAATLLQAGPHGAHGAGYGSAGLVWSPLAVLVMFAVLALVVYLAVSRPESAPDGTHSGAINDGRDRRRGRP